MMPDHLAIKRARQTLDCDERLPIAAYRPEINLQCIVENVEAFKKTLLAKAFTIPPTGMV